MIEITLDNQFVPKHMEASGSEWTVSCEALQTRQVRESWEIRETKERNSRLGSSTAQ